MAEYVATKFIKFSSWFSFCYDACHPVWKVALLSLQSSDNILMRRKNEFNPSPSKSIWWTCRLHLNFVPTNHCTCRTVQITVTSPCWSQSEHFHREPLCISSTMLQCSGRVYSPESWTLDDWQLSFITTEATEILLIKNMTLISVLIWTLLCFTQGEENHFSVMWKSFGV